MEAAEDRQQADLGYAPNPCSCFSHTFRVKRRSRELCALLPTGTLRGDNTARAESPPQVALAGGEGTL